MSKMSNLAIDAQNAEKELKPCPACGCRTIDKCQDAMCEDIAVCNRCGLTQTLEEWNIQPYLLSLKSMITSHSSGSAVDCCHCDTCMKLRQLEEQLKEMGELASRVYHDRDSIPLGQFGIKHQQILEATGTVYVYASGEDLEPIEIDGMGRGDFGKPVRDGEVDSYEVPDREVDDE